MKVLSIIPFVLGLISATPALALDRLEILAQENPQATPFEVLKKLYDESTVPADVMDFDTNLTKNSSQDCWVARVDTKKKDLFEGFVLRYMEQIAAVPSKGPLFPGTPARTEDKDCLMIGTNRKDEVLKEYYKELCSRVKTEKTDTDLVNAIPKSQFYWASPVMSSFRKNGSLIALKMIVSAGTKNAFTEYGYCYR